MTQHRALYKRTRHAVATVASLLVLLCAAFNGSQELRAQDGARTIDPIKEYRFNFEKSVKQPALSGVALTRDRAALYVGGDDQRVYTCPVDGDSNIFQATGQATSEWVRAVAASPTANEIATLSQNGIIAIWDLGKKQVVRQTSQQIVGAHAMAYAPTGSLIAVASYEPIVRVFDAATLKLVASWRAPGASSTALQFSPDGEYLAVGGRNGVARVWTTRTPPTVKDYELRNLNAGDALGGKRRIRALAFSPDNKFLAVAGDANQIVVYDLQAQKQVASLVPRDGKVYSLAFLGYKEPGNKILLVSGDSSNNLRVFDVKRQRLVASSDNSASKHTGTVSSLLVEQVDGAGKPTTRVYSTSFDTTVKLWDLSEDLKISNSL